MSRQPSRRGQQYPGGPRAAIEPCRVVNGQFARRLCVPRWQRWYRRSNGEAADSMMRRYLTVPILTAIVAMSSASIGLGQTPAALSQSVPDSSGPARVGGCPGGNGIHISTTSGTLSESGSGTNTIITPSQSIDTTLVFDISQKTWTRTNFAAAISVGLADESRGRYSVCAGVTAMMPSATLTIRGARGRVHFVASLKSLSDALRLGPGAMSPPPRRL